MNISELTSFVWNIANLLRGDFKRAQYPDVILPFVVLRRIDSVLQPTREQVREREEKFAGKIAPDALDKQLRRAAGFAFYNTSAYDFERLYQDSGAVYDNLIAYLNGFSPNMRDVLDKFRFRQTLKRLDDNNLLYLVLGEFRKIDLHPDHVTNQMMGTLFENLLRKFNEAANENPGEHFTPPDVVTLMVDLLLSADEQYISQHRRTVTVYDPCCGTGGMLTRAKERIMQTNPTATVVLFGQEINPETYAICKSDLYISGDDSDAENIGYGSTLSDDQHATRRFNYLIANPPYGSDWRKEKSAVEREAKNPNGRFAAGTPRINDGQMLFIQHMVARMYARERDHSRMAIITNGSPLFTGDAGGGESEIRRWLLENDWLETIIALPEQLFYNTGIATYVWLLTMDKPAERTGQVQLIDATGQWTPMRKSLGDKRREVGVDQAGEIVGVYREPSLPAPSPAQRILREGEGGKIESLTFPREQFGYRKIQIERPLRLRFVIDEAGLARLAEQRAFVNLAVSKKRNAETRKVEEEAGREMQTAIRALLLALPQKEYDDRAPFMKAVNAAAKRRGIKLTAGIRKAIWQGLGERDETAAICRNGKGEPEADGDLRDYERVPLGERVDDYFVREVAPYLPDAWINRDYTDEKDGGVGRVGYEINFNRYFYTYEPPRPLSEIEADIAASERRIADLLAAVTGGMR